MNIIVGIKLEHALAIASQYIHVQEGIVYRVVVGVGVFIGRCKLHFLLRFVFP